MKSLSLEDITYLTALIQMSHGPCAHLRTVHIHQVHEGRTLWTGPVAIFKLENHPTADECFAWLSDELQETSSPAVYVKSPAIPTAAAAVKTYVLDLCANLVA